MNARNVLCLGVWCVMAVSFVWSPEAGARYDAGVELLVRVLAGAEEPVWPEEVLRVRPIRGAPIYRVWVVKGREDRAIEALEAQSSVGFVEKVRTFPIQALPLNAAWQDVIRTGELQRLSDGAGVVVALVDTGVDMENPDLALSLWSNPGEIPGDGIDNDGNGFVDDAAGYDFGDEDAEPRDENGHGTAVASVVLGTAPGCAILPLKANEGSGRGITTGAAVQAIFYAIGAGARVINMSFSGPGTSPRVALAVEEAFRNGISLVGAAGNTGGEPVEFPANMDEVIAVGSVDGILEVASFSARGPEMDIVAPGVDIEALAVGGGTAFASGTSLSTPMVAGALAVLRGMNRNLRVETARGLLFAGSADLGEPGRDPLFGEGALDGEALLLESSPRLIVPAGPVAARGAPLTLLVHLPPTDAEAEVYIALAGRETFWWLGPGGVWHDVSIRPLERLALIEPYSVSIEGALFGDDGVFPPFSTASWESGDYVWGIALKIPGGPLLAPVTSTPMSLR